MRPALVLGALGLVGCAIGLALAPALTIPAWLVAGQAALVLALGALTILLIHTLSGGKWGETAGPQLRVIAGTLPLTLLILAPLLLAIPTILPFLHAAPDTLPEAVQKKLAYLQPGWLAGRSVLVALAWLAASGFAGLLPLLRLRNSKAGAVVGLVLIVLGTMIFTTDWGQALEPAFKSTIYPLMVLGAGLVGAFAFVILLLPPGADPKGDQAKLLIAAILDWIYLAFMQWLIIWLGDLPDEAAWYLRRVETPWQWVLVALCLLFAALPFLIMLLHRVRTSGRLMQPVAAMVLLGFLLDNAWRLAPPFGASPAYLLLIVCAHLAVGGALLLAARPRLGALTEAPHV